MQLKQLPCHSPPTLGDKRFQPGKSEIIVEESQIMAIILLRLFAYILCYFATHLACSCQGNGPSIRIMKRRHRTGGAMGLLPILHLGNAF
jgi:hypothetical protein